MTDTNITETSMALFLAFARDAGNWSGNPCVGGNTGGTKEQRGNLTQLKKAGLIQTFKSDGQTYIEFLPAGKAFAKERGVDLDWI